MTTKPLILTLTTLTFATLSNLATAAPNDSRFPIDIAAAEARQTERFEKLDQNDDGVVTLAEFEQADFDPQMRHHRQRGEQTGPRPGKHAARATERAHSHRKAMRDAAEDELFKILDTNNDGSLSKTEFAAKDRTQMKLSRKRAAFARFDKDQNGQLERSEMASHLARLKSADRDGDGLVTRRELREARRSQRQDSEAG